MSMESLMDISEASRQNSVAVFSWTTEQAGDFKNAEMAPYS